MKYLANFWRLLEMPLINSKIHFRLKWNKKCIYIPLVTLPTKGNVKLTKQLIDGYK